MSPAVLLIFGTSHVGKSTLAGRVGHRLGWPVVSTDTMGRHPGRPWPQVRPPVAEYYARLTDETIYWFLRAHHENLWPLVEARVRAARDSGSGLVLEGSALRPEFIANLEGQGALTVGLHADPTCLRRRIELASGYDERDDHGRLLNNRFVSRSVRDNDQIVEDARRLGLRLTDTANPTELERLYTDLTAALAGAGRNSSASRA